MTTKELYARKADCCGCGACAAACPKQAISMQADADGFVYPQIDEKLCVDCGLCRKVCAYQSGQQPESQKETYAAVSGDTDIRESASGGLFASLAQAVMADGGVVYGCEMASENGRLAPRHVCAEQMTDLIRLKGSKYVKSDLTGIFADVKSRLSAGQKVLFSGTPCQVAGLKGFLRREYDDLFTVEIICHGVPSAKLFGDYIAYEEKRLGKKITGFRFRDKSRGWKLLGAMTTLDADGKQETRCFEPEESSYYQMFLNSYTYRENCYACPYASERRAADLTIGDYWCIELVHPEMIKENGGALDHGKGASCMIINNDKGRKLLARYGSGIRRWASTYENAARYNRQLTAPSAMKPERKEVLALNRKGYEHVEAWYRRRLRPIRIKRAIRKAIPRPVKDLLKAWIRR